MTFTYLVRAQVWAGTEGRIWSGEVTIPYRADCKTGFEMLRSAARREAEQWLRANKYGSVAREFTMTSWQPKPAK